METTADTGTAAPIDLARLRATPATQSPFPHLVVPGFVTPEALPAINADYPKIRRGGSLPLGAVDGGPAFAGLIAALRGPEMTAVMGETFGLDLSARPTMVTVRANCRAKDGRIHTDSRGKLVTVLVYMNAGWESDGGRLRLLNGPDDIEDYAVEVPPDAGTLVAFRCTDNAWHGHKRFVGERRAVQLNWVVDERYAGREQRRHGLSALVKKLGFAS